MPCDSAIERVEPTRPESNHAADGQAIKPRPLPFDAPHSLTTTNTGARTTTCSSLIVRLIIAAAVAEPAPQESFRPAWARPPDGGAWQRAARSTGWDECDKGHSAAQVRSARSYLHAPRIPTAEQIIDHQRRVSSLIIQTDRAGRCL